MPQCANLTSGREKTLRIRPSMGHQLQHLAHDMWVVVSPCSGYPAHRDKYTVFQAPYLTLYDIVHMLYTNY